jgi:hypothetical protein
MRALRIRRAVVAAALFALAVQLSAVPAVASAPPGATLNLAWSAPDVSRQVFAVTLTCFPAGGGEDAYMDADAACADLTRAGGDFSALPGSPFISCENYQGWSIRTTATGTWFGHPIHYDVLHANLCHARKATGSVFRF